MRSTCQKQKKQTFHVLIEFHSRGQVETLFVQEVTEEEEPEEQFFPVKTTSQTVDLYHLNEGQQDQVKETPGQTMAVKHNIILQPDASPQRKSYRVPERLVGALKEELDVMLSLGVVEPSSSDWCSPVVLVPKRDGTIRFCIDYRKVSALSKVDPFPMPRIDDLLERLGKAKYISTIDLSQGLLASATEGAGKGDHSFPTPFGLYHFRVMPAGSWADDKSEEVCTGEERSTLPGVCDW